MHSRLGRRTGKRHSIHPNAKLSTSNHMILDYTICDQVLETDESATYLGVKLHATASWSPHCSTTSKKAECTRAFLQRNLASTPQPIKKQCYTTLLVLRPILEYASAVWDPHCQSDIQKLELIQRRYARFTCGDYSRESSVTEMLQTLGWDTMAERRAKLRQDLVHVVDIPLDQHFTELTTRTRGNSEKFRVPYSRTLSAKHSFFPDATRIWNNIPDDATRAESLDTFKSRLAGLSIRTWAPIFFGKYHCTYMHRQPQLTLSRRCSNIIFKDSAPLKEEEVCNLLSPNQSGYNGKLYNTQVARWNLWKHTIVLCIHTLPLVGGSWMYILLIFIYKWVTYLIICSESQNPIDSWRTTWKRCAEQSLRSTGKRCAEQSV